MPPASELPLEIIHVLPESFAVGPQVEALDLYIGLQDGFEKLVQDKRHGDVPWKAGVIDHQGLEPFLKDRLVLLAVLAEHLVICADRMQVVQDYLDLRLRRLHQGKKTALEVLFPLDRLNCGLLEIRQVLLYPFG